MKLTYELIQHVTNMGCLNKTQAELLGTPFPLLRGWIRSLEGKDISVELYQRVLAVRGLPPNKRKQVLKLDRQAQLL